MGPGEIVVQEPYAGVRSGPPKLLSSCSALIRRNSSIVKLSSASSQLPHKPVMRLFAKLAWPAAKAGRANVQAEAASEQVFPLPGYA